MRGGVELGLRPKLADGLPGVREYFSRYPWSCLEQQASVSVGLRDAARWRGLMERLPLYLDDDGLAHYFPPSVGAEHQGSDTLTAYLLSLSAEAGSDYAIPDAARARMEAGLLAFVEGDARLGLLRALGHLRVDRGDVLLVDRDRVRTTQESGHLGRVLDEVIGALVQLHLNEDVPGVKLARSRPLLALDHLQHRLCWNQNLAELTVHGHLLDTLL